MIAKHSAFYLLARGIPAVVNLLALGIFTRLLTPLEYGQYALVVAGAGLVGSLLYQWLQLGLLRFLASEEKRPEPFLSTMLGGFAGLSLLSVALGWVAVLLIEDPGLKRLVLLGVLLLCTQSFFELNQEVLRSRLFPGAYGLASIIRAVSSLGIGWIAAQNGWGAEGLIVGMILGYLLPLLWQVPRNWKGVRPQQFDRRILMRLVRYGTPLILTLAFGFIVSSSDRFLLAWLLDADSAGLYSVGYNFAQHTLVTLMMVVNLAAYPLAVRALEESGHEAARHQVARNGRMLLMIACPAATGMALLAPNISGVFLGGPFQEAAVELIPLICLGAFLAGVKAFHLDLSFQLGQRTVHQMWVVMIAAAVNLGLNVWWIPLFGILGSAYATVVAYFVAAVLSWIVGRRIFPVPFEPLSTLKITGATMGMALALMPIRESTGAMILLFQIAWGALVYATALLLMHWGEVRRAYRIISVRAREYRI